MRVLSLAAIKGGVSKTVSSANIGYVLAEMLGYRVLLVDNDKQGNLSTLFGTYSRDKKSIADILQAKNVADVDMSEIIQQTKYDNIHMISANMTLVSTEEIARANYLSMPQLNLKKALATVVDQYDFCIIDNAPDLNVGVAGALVASNEILVPVKIDNFSLDGLKELSEQIRGVQNVNVDLKYKCFATFGDNTVSYRKNYRILKEDSDYPTMNTVIRRTVRVDESTFANMPVVEHAPDSTAAQDYIALVHEYMGWIKAND